MNNNADYIKAARISASDPAKRLPQVVTLLRAAGIEIDDNVIDSFRVAAQASKSKKLVEKREANGGVDFSDGGDEFLQRLFEAYKAGISFNKIGNEVNITRTSMYRYLHRESYPREKDRERIIAAIDKYLPRN